VAIRSAISSSNDAKPSDAAASSSASALGKYRYNV
jgi:hypothetical protein